MKQATIMLVVFGTLFAGNLSVRADSGNPFGFETNKHPLEYEYCKKHPYLVNGLYGYECSSAPRIHPEFKEYFLFFVEDVGLCSIWNTKYIGIDLDKDKSSGLAKMRNVVERFKGQIAKKYGPPTRKADNLLSSPSLRESTYGYDWAPEEGFKGLGDVNAIKLEFSSVPESRWPYTEVPQSISQLESGLDREVETFLEEHAGPQTLHFIFWLGTFDKCLKEIDDKRYSAF